MSDLLSNKKEQVIFSRTSGDNIVFDITIRGTGRKITVSPVDGTIEINTNKDRSVATSNMIRHVFESIGLPHKIIKNSAEWYVQYPGNRSFKLFDGMKITMSGKQLVCFYRKLGRDDKREFKMSLDQQSNDIPF